MNAYSNIALILICVRIIAKITDMDNKAKIKITLDDYCYNCADGCCTNYGTIVKVNGVEMPFHNQDVKTILEQVLQHLGYDVEIIQTDNGE